MKTAFETLQNLPKIIREALDSIEKSIPEIENKDVKRISEHCFTINSSVLIDNVWNPEFYDYRKQIQILVDVLNSTKPENLVAKFKDIFETNSVMTSSGLRKLNPDYLSIVKSSLNF